MSAEGTDLESLPAAALEGEARSIAFREKVLSGEEVSVACLRGRVGARRVSEGSRMMWINANELEEEGQEREGERRRSRSLESAPARAPTPTPTPLETKPAAALSLSLSPQRTKTR
jgi:hypothetical protein